jgi:glutamate racemase
MRLGIFDSGVGGLTFAAAIKEVLPQHQIIYYGDTVHLPYGDKSPEAIIGFSKKISRFLVEQKCDAILIACNSASATAYPHLIESGQFDLPIFNVIDPVIEHLSTIEKDAVVGIIGTRATIKSKVFKKKIRAKFTHMDVRSYPTPLLAPMIEDGFVHDAISLGVVRRYLQRKKLKGISHLVLGCTHYPLIESDFILALEGKAEVINPVGIVAKFLKGRYEESNGSHEEDLFYVSDLTDSFRKMAKTFFGKKLNLIEKNIW